MSGSGNWLDDLWNDLVSFLESLFGQAPATTPVTITVYPLSGEPPLFVSVSGTAPPSATFTIYSNEEVLTTGQASTTGTWSVGITINDTSVLYAEVTENGVMVKSNSVTITVSAGAASAIVLTANPTDVASGGTSTFTATVTDASSNPVSGVQLYVFENGTESATLPPLTGTNGETTFTLTFTTAGTDSIDVSTDTANT